MYAPATEGSQPELCFKLQELPVEVQLAIVGKASPMAKRVMFAAAHSTRELVLCSCPTVTLTLVMGSRYDMLARMVHVPADMPGGVRELRICKLTGQEPKYVQEIVAPLLQSSKAKALEVWTDDLQGVALSPADAAAWSALQSLSLDLSLGAGSFVPQLEPICTHLTRLELMYGAATDSLAHLARGWPTLRELHVYSVYTEGFDLPADVLSRITKLSVDVEPPPTEERPPEAGTWLGRLCLQPGDFSRLHTLVLFSALPWGVLLKLGRLPALESLRVRRLHPPGPGSEEGPLSAPSRPLPKTLRVLQIGALHCREVPRLPCLKQVPELRLDTLVLPSTAAVMQELQQAAAALAALPRIVGRVPNTSAAFMRCIALDGFPLEGGMDQSVLPMYGEMLAPMAHHLSEVGLNLPSGQHLVRVVGALSKGLAPHARTLSIGRCLAGADELWAVLAALPGLNVLCVEVVSGELAHLHGLIRTCEAARRPLELQVHCSRSLAEAEEAGEGLSGSCTCLVRVVVAKYED